MCTMTTVFVDTDDDIVNGRSNAHIKAIGSTPFPHQSKTSTEGMLGRTRITFGLTHHLERWWVLGGKSPLESIISCMARGHTLFALPSDVYVCPSFASVLLLDVLQTSSDTTNFLPEYVTRSVLRCCLPATT